MQGTEGGHYKMGVGAVFIPTKKGRGMMALRFWLGSLKSKHCFIQTVESTSLRNVLAMLKGREAQKV